MRKPHRDEWFRISADDRHRMGGAFATYEDSSSRKIYLVTPDMADLVADDGLIKDKIFFLAVNPPLADTNALTPHVHNPPG